MDSTFAGQKLQEKYTTRLQRTYRKRGIDAFTVDKWTRNQLFVFHFWIFARNVVLKS